MSLPTQPYKGARDFYPQDKRVQKYMFAKIRHVAEAFGYQEYDAPLLEPLELYQAKTGDEIVNEQTYAFRDRGGRQVAIRPEMTPSVSRMVAARRQELAYPLRLYNIGQRMRYERPQRGRNREFWQADIDLFGVEGIEGDAEIIQIASGILRSLGASPAMYRININSRQSMVKSLQDMGIAEAEIKAAYKLIDKMPRMDEGQFDQLMADQLGAEKAAKLQSFLKSDQPPENVKRLLDLLKSSGAESVYYEPSAVRGIDYYTDIVFEVFDTDPENARSLFGGGRYDGLVGLFGVEPVATVGFAVGDVTLQNFLESHNLLPKQESDTEASVILVGDVYAQSQEPIGRLREAGVRIAVDPTDRKLDFKIKSAVKSGVRYAIFIGEKELAANQFTLRDLNSGEEKTLTIDQIAAAIRPN